MARRRKTSRSMRPGECRTTKTGRRFCYEPGEGVRFQPGGSRRSARLSGAQKACIRYKTVQTSRGPARRCAKFAPVSAVRNVGDFGGGVRTCIRKKRVRSKKTGRMMTRCAKYA